MFQLIIITSSLFLTVFCRQESESMELTWWDAHVPHLAMTVLFALWLLNPNLYEKYRTTIFKNTMLMFALAGVLGILLFSRANSSIYAMYITLSVPSILYFYDKNRYTKIFAILSFIACGTAVITVASRTGIIAIAISLIFFISLYFKVKPKTILFFTFFFIGLLVFMFLFVKKDSSTGRMFIIKNTAKMIIDKPFGWGNKGFEANYMRYQANYFSNRTDEKAEMLADNIKHPLNEFLYIAVNYGVPVLLLTLYGVLHVLFMLNKENNKENKCYIHFIMLLLLWGCFSYPLSISFVLVQLLAFIPITPKIGQILFKQNAIRYSIIFIMIIYGVTELVALNHERKWNCAIKEYKKGNIATATKIFNSFSSDITTNRGEILYSLATIEYNNKEYEKCINTCKRSKQYLASYDLELLLANCYYFIGEHRKSLEHFTVAHHMCPNRFIPLYKQFKIYNESGDKINMTRIGNEILSKKIKVQSQKINIIINNVKYMLINNK